MAEIKDTATEIQNYVEKLNESEKLTLLGVLKGLDLGKNLQKISKGEQRYISGYVQGLSDAADQSEQSAS